MAKTAQSRFLPALAMCLLGCTASGGSAQAGLFDFGAGKKPATDTQTPAATIKDGHIAGADLDTLIRQAQLERTGGQYQESVKTLSQLMLVAADDGRVVSEYGKTLVSMGRATEALGFLTRAEQLQADDWTVYNALGVAYDQLDKQTDARAAYEHALTLKPGEAAVLNNYALSRMLAKDPEGARNLIARAEGAGGASDPKIARNIAMIRELSPQATAHDVAMAQPVAAPRAAVSTQPLTPPQSWSATPASMAPRALQPAQPQFPARDNRVVMQRVPVDPLAGPVAGATHASRGRQARPVPERPMAAKAQATPEPKTDAVARADAVAKAPREKPVAASRPATPKPELPRAVARVDMTAPNAVPVKTAAKDAIPALRMSANTY